MIYGLLGLLRHIAVLLAFIELRKSPARLVDGVVFRFNIDARPFPDSPTELNPATLSRHLLSDVVEAAVHGANRFPA